MKGVREALVLKSLFVVGSVKGRLTFMSGFEAFFEALNCNSYS